MQKTVRGDFPGRFVNSIVSLFFTAVSCYYGKNILKEKRENKKMRFRPCIDIHNGAVKQIVGGSLSDRGDMAETNFTAEQDAAWYAKLYKKDGLMGGHVILLNPPASDYYKETKSQALRALAAYPGGLQIGGGITAENAAEYLEAGASHVIVTSYVFQNGTLNYENLAKLETAVGKERIVLDLSCRRRDGKYDIVTDRWQKFTDVELNEAVLENLSSHCSEFLVHGVDVEGKSAGMEEELVTMLGDWAGRPITYAGGIGTMEELERFRELGKGRLDFTIGSALDLFGGNLSYETVREIR